MEQRNVGVFQLGRRAMRLVTRPLPHRIRSYSSVRFHFQ